MDPLERQSDLRAKENKRYNRNGANVYFPWPAHGCEYSGALVLSSAAGLIFISTAWSGPLRYRLRLTTEFPYFCLSFLALPEALCTGPGATDASKSLDRLCLCISPYANLPPPPPSTRVIFRQVKLLSYTPKNGIGRPINKCY